ncbi:hypothetical protein [Rhodoferax sp. UBA5149]|uniref:hypothetical protein n=1 Tax=Rhodoferax sp. UBA5149 TaxID=1947379 RepID=UPI0025F762F8|nr:hypothetical protein [Rhodoferax sp. UBA5149]
MTNFTHYHLTAEQFSDESGPAIMLTQQDGIEDPVTIVAHPWQLRAVCEQFGLIASDPAAQKTIAMLTRRLLVLRDRIDHLGDYLTNYSDHEHANLEYELTYITATTDIAEEFCADLVDTSAPEILPAPMPSAKPIGKPSLKPSAQATPPQETLI